ncbi:MAG: AbrB/MazE/SpoVT family DNA-binding domain-containing protein [Caulobacteraceae bacterium]|nr:AbrB/MazE/SpoVT family DNA-binding domain-containing protein [Caulobacteraceae bacterium]
MAPNGRIVVPARMRAALGLERGGRLIARLVGRTVVLEPLDAAIRRAQASVRRYVPPGSGLVEELIAERRAAAERE